MRFLSATAALAIAGCHSAPSIAAQPAQRILETFDAGLRGCAAPLTQTGSIDQQALARSGWRVTARFSEFGGERQTYELNAYPQLAETRTETTQWVRDGSPYSINLTRSANGPQELEDSCFLPARAESDQGAEEVAAGLTRAFGRAPDLTGTQRPGGDGLTPRFFQPSPARIRYWAMPQHDVYLLTGDDQIVELRVISMPDRAALDPYSTDRPEHIIVTEEGSS